MTRMPPILNLQDTYEFAKKWYILNKGTCKNYTYLCKLNSTYFILMWLYNLTVGLSNVTCWNIHFYISLMMICIDQNIFRIHYMLFKADIFSVMVFFHMLGNIHLLLNIQITGQLFFLSLNRTCLTVYVCECVTPWHDTTIHEWLKAS